MKKRLSLIVIAIMFILGLAGCGNKVYRDFNSSLVTLDKDNCFEKVSESEILKILDTAKSNDVANEITYVFYASPLDSDSPTVLEVLMQQAKQYQVEKIYYLCSDKYDGVEKRDAIEEAMGFHDASIIPSLLAYVDGVNKFDSSKNSVKLYYDSSYASMSRYIFVDLPASLVE